MPVTDQDLRCLTYLARRLRDDTQGCGPWDDAGTFSSFKTALANQNLLIATQRVLAHATDPEAKTPGAIKRPFTPEPNNTPARIPFDPRAVCHVCAKHQHAPTDHPFVSVEAKRAAVPAPMPDEIRRALGGRQGTQRHTSTQAATEGTNR